MIKNYREFINEARSFKQKNKARPIRQIFGMLPQNIDYRILDHILTEWGDHYKKSPYGHSYYSKEKSWASTVDNSYRLSDHWNFVTHRSDRVHCKTNKPVGDNTHWTIGQYDKDTDTYKVLMSYPFDDSKKNKSMKNKIKIDFYRNFKETTDFEEINKTHNMLKTYLEDNNLYAKIQMYSYGEPTDKYSGQVLRLKSQKMRIRTDDNKEMPFNHSNFTRSDITFFDKDGKELFHKPTKQNLYEAEPIAADFYG